MLNTVALRRHLIALLAAFSLILPFVGGFVQQNSTLSSMEGAQSIVLAHDELSVIQHLTAPDSSPERLAEYEDAYSGDYSHEVDKLLSFISHHWDKQATSWPGAYFVALATDPVFPFERPPKNALRLVTL